jgi:Spy/CpxP family protein refolding chaperone
MRPLIAGSLIALGLLAVLPAPASAQSFGVGPGGVEFDPRTRRQRERDFERAQMRREMMREERREMRRDMRRRERWEDERRYRRGYY